MVHWKWYIQRQQASRKDGMNIYCVTVGSSGYGDTNNQRLREVSIFLLLK